MFRVFMSNYIWNYLTESVATVSCCAAGAAGSCEGSSTGCATTVSTARESLMLFTMPRSEPFANTPLTDTNVKTATANTENFFIILSF